MKYIPLDSKALIDVFIEGEIECTNIDGNDYQVHQADRFNNLNDFKEDI